MVKNLPAKAGDAGLIPGSGRSPWRRKWQPTPVFFLGASHRQRNLMGYSPWGLKESDMTEQLDNNNNLKGVLESSATWLELLVLKSQALGRVLEYISCVTQTLYHR